MVFCSLIASSAIRAFISALKLRRCLDFISAPFPRRRFYTLLTGPNFGEQFTQRTKLGFILVAKFLALIPFLLCVALVQQKLFGSKNMVMPAAISYGIFYVSTVFQMRKFP